MTYIYKLSNANFSIMIVQSEHCNYWITYMEYKNRTRKVFFSARPDPHYTSYQSNRIMKRRKIGKVYFIQKDLLLYTILMTGNGSDTYVYQNFSVK